MIKAEIFFSLSDAIQVFRDAGLVVEMRDFKISFPVPHREEMRIETIPIMAVINPYTGVAEKLEESFNKYLSIKKKQIFLSPEKLEIYNLFKKQIQ